MGIVVAILKMATGRNFSMSGINSGHHNLPTYEMSLKSDNVEFVRYCGDHFEIGDRQKFFDLGNQFGTS
jgi:5-carboxymethyl-2-hydroxymuconate isomerase